MTTPSNQLVDALPALDRRRLLALCEPVPLLVSQVLGVAGQATRHVYFPTRGFVSQIATLDALHGLEVGMVGDEGLLGVHVALGAVADPLQALVQGAGAAWRMEVAAFRTELAGSAPLRQQLLRYASVLLAQRAASTACLRFHEIGPRLARWLLMSQDRVHAAVFPVTHEFLAAMLGVRRVGVTTAAGDLQRRGLIHYHRGHLTVLDRPGLARVSCSCYAHDQQLYTQLMAAPVLPLAA